MAVISYFRTALLGGLLGGLLSLATTAGASGTVPYIVALDRPALMVPMAWAEHAGAVIQCESRWDTNAVGSAGELGLLQIHPIHETGMRRQGLDWHTEVDRVKYAVTLWSRQGWSPWSCKP